MGYERNDWLKNFGKNHNGCNRNENKCAPEKSHASSHSSHSSHSSSSSGSSSSGSCASSYKSSKACTKSYATSCTPKCDTVKKTCKKQKEKVVVDGKKRVIHENVCVVRHRKKVYIQPVCRTKHETETIVYKLPTKYVDECERKDCGVKYVKVHRKPKCPPVKPPC